ncbi:hypothetical protein [Nocardioides bruguierae]|uniref:Uncharacterized protein n=1 Tax=Nocardioides bruguierae TaxID=2945102 RepID=A0A9X2D5M3_9ACTN|nr:hypothetical protein [Nocardioides bruguierae]MCM0619505.1 hypothetical protein [Nocardioides bruguierae]
MPASALAHVVLIAAGVGFTGMVATTLTRALAAHGRTTLGLVAGSVTLGLAGVLAVQAGALGWVGTLS